MPNAVCLIAKRPLAVNSRAASSTRTGTVTGCVVSRIVSRPATTTSSVAASRRFVVTPVLSNVMRG